MKKTEEPEIDSPQSAIRSPQSALRNPKMMLAFVIRRCAVELGHAPSPAEFAEWANGQNGYRHRRSLFGRPISEQEARIILRHQSRLVSAKSATPEETYVERDEQAKPPRVSNLVALDEARGRRTPARQPRRTRRPRRS